MSDEDLSNWMTNLPEDIKNKPITSLAIPGSHDSFATKSSLSTTLPVANDASRGLRKFGQLPGARWFIRRWAATQVLGIEEQLRAGIRYLDLRVSLPPEKLQRDRSFRVVHALYGDELKDILQSVRKFLSTHPKEVVIIDLNHLYGFDEEVDFRNLRNLVMASFSRSQIAPPPTPLSSVAQYTLRRLQDQGHNVIVLSSRLDVDDVMWPSCLIRAPWPDSDDVPYIISYLDQLSIQWRKHAVPPMFMVYQGVATAAGKDICFHLLSTLMTVLSGPMTKATCEWVEKKTYTDGINIVICDAVSPDSSRKVIAINFCGPSTKF